MGSKLWNEVGGEVDGGIEAGEWEVSRVVV